MQGKAALLDLARSGRVREIICADVSLKEWDKLAAITDVSKIKPVQVDGSSKKALVALFKQGFDAVIDLLPLPFMANAFEAALETRVPLVSTNYGKPIQHLHEPAKAAGVALMPECGLDPGIDLVICGHAVKQFDELHVLNSYCGGIPEKKACTNPLDYKISWNFDMVLRSQKRPAVFIRKGRKILESRPTQQHENDMIHTIQFPGLGDMEAVPNGDAAFYTELLSVTPASGRPAAIPCAGPDGARSGAPIETPGASLRRTRKGFGLRRDPPPVHGEAPRTPASIHRMAKKTWWPWYNIFSGLKTAAAKTITSTLLVIERDLKSGLYGMSLGVGYPASIVAQMIAGGEITSKRRSQPRVACSLCPVHGGFGPAGNRRHGRGGIEPQPTPKARRNGS